MKNVLKWIASDESGQGMVEYALIFVLLILIALVGLNSLKDGIVNMYNKIILNIA